MVARAVLLAAMIPTILASQQASSGHAGSPIMRLEAGTLTPGDLTIVTLALGASAGWQVTDHTGLLLRYLRQSQNRSTGDDIGRLARSFITANWEHAFGTSSKYHRQAMVRVGIGALIRPYLKTSAVLGTGFELRYALTGNWSLVGNIEDDMGWLPREDFQSCPNCTVYTYGGYVQHNLGFVVAGEWRP